MRLPSRVGTAVILGRHPIARVHLAFIESHDMEAFVTHSNTRVIHVSHLKRKRFRFIFPSMVIRCTHVFKVSLLAELSRHSSLEHGYRASPASVDTDELL